MELDLQELRARLVVDGQVSAAGVTKTFPDTLEVRLAEREPVVRLRTEIAPGVEGALLVARDGVVFAGTGFTAPQLEKLPWLAGVRLTRAARGFVPVAGMPKAAELLDQARRETPRLFATWRLVSIAALASDGEIEVRTTAGTTIVFGTKTGFFPQLAKLDALAEALAAAPAPPAKIDLSLGREVPVSFAPTQKSATGVSLFKLPQPKSTREL
jgi:cell division protein FtsQ